MDQLLPGPALEFAMELRVRIAPAVDLGAGPFGVRRCIPITGGTFRGPQIAGKVLAGGADWQYVEADGMTHVEALYVIETDDGARIEVRNQGVRHGAKEVLARIAAGEDVPADQYYFRTTPRFYPPAGKYEWLRKSIFIAEGERHASEVIIRAWKVG